MPDNPTSGPPIGGVDWPENIQLIAVRAGSQGISHSGRVAVIELVLVASEIGVNSRLRSYAQPSADSMAWRKALIWSVLA